MVVTHVPHISNHQDRNQHGQVHHGNLLDSFTQQEKYCIEKKVKEHDHDQVSVQTVAYNDVWNKNFYHVI